jgi:ABC-type nitrate/sulfonate/bicarbonate transport system permease component
LTGLNAKSLLGNRWAVRLYSLIIFLTAWQLVGSSVNPILFSPPLRVAVRFSHLWADGTLPTQIIVTLETVLICFVISAAIAIPIGLAMGNRRILEYSIDPWVNLVYSTPTVAVIPLLIIWFGANLSASYVAVLLHTIPPVLINTMIGVKAISRSLAETGKSFGFQGLRLWRKVVLPASVPYIMAGLRIGMGAAVIGTMVAEIFMYTTGLGYIIVYYASIFDTAAVISGVLIVMALGIVLAEAIKLIGRRFSGWAVGATGIA